MQAVSNLVRQGQYCSPPTCTYARNCGFPYFESVVDSWLPLVESAASVELMCCTLVGNHHHWCNFCAKRFTAAQILFVAETLHIIFLSSEVISLVGAGSEFSPYKNRSKSLVTLPIIGGGRSVAVGCVGSRCAFFLFIHWHHFSLSSFDIQSPWSNGIVRGCTALSKKYSSHLSLPLINSLVKSFSLVSC